MLSKVHKLLAGFLITMAVLTVFAPAETSARRIIFYAPRSRQIVTGQILSARATEVQCEKCHMRDHRGHCRRMLSFNVDGVKC